MLVVISLYYFKKDTVYLNPLSYKTSLSIPTSSFNLLNTSVKTTPAIKSKKIIECTKEDLMNAKGVGDKTASLIMENIISKKVNNINDIDNIKGIGPKTINELKKYCY